MRKKTRNKPGRDEEMNGKQKRDAEGEEKMGKRFERERKHRNLVMKRLRKR